MTGVSECSQQRGNLKDDGYIRNLILPRLNSMIYGIEFLGRGLKK
ncbi:MULTISPECIES: hypothetical protein [Photorhabdus]|nr:MULTISPECIES: hypothetical protein [Photorhabdus]